jgi:hypothetical protein
MTPEEPLDDDVFINAILLANGAIEATIGYILHPKASVQLSPKAQAQASSDIEHDSESNPARMH